jgi:alkanesulfonate monooxygenase SsuD/methylene tetrahydromethanopterin reductase-like flavin-dependent oxidoreductase (luciferase family)
LAAGGPQAAKLAAEIADGVCGTEPSADVFKPYLKSGGRKDSVWAQIVTSYAPTVKEGLCTAFETFRFVAGGWKVQAELPNPVNFGAATSAVKPEDLAESIPAGKDPQLFAASMQKFLKLGVTNLAVAYPGQDLGGFLSFWQKELRPLLP